MRLENRGPVLQQVISHENNFRTNKKGRPVGRPLRFSSWLNAFDVGSPHPVLWTVCSPGAGATRWGWRAAAGLIRRAAVDSMSGQ